MKLDRIKANQKQYAVEVSDSLGSSVVEAVEEMCRRNMKCGAIDGADDFKPVFIGSLAECLDKQSSLRILYDEEQTDGQTDDQTEAPEDIQYAIIADHDGCSVNVITVEELLSRNIDLVSKGEPVKWVPIYMSYCPVDINEKMAWLNDGSVVFG